MVTATYWGTERETSPVSFIVVKRSRLFCSLVCLFKRCIFGYVRCVL